MANLNDECAMELTSTDNLEFFTGEDICPQAVRYREYIRRAYEAATLEMARKEEVSPPAPPSTPTMLTPTNTSSGIGGFILNGNGTNGIFITSGSSISSSNSSTNTICTSTYDYLKERVNNILHILDFSPPRKSTNHNPSQGTDGELSDLFNDVSINGTIARSHKRHERTSSLTKVQGEHGVSILSRSIRKHKLSTINAALQRAQSHTLGQSESPLQYDDEDTVSAPECVEENFRRKRRLNRLRLLKRFIKTKRQQERIDSMVNMFHGGLNFKDA